jgi:hypothetical protein
MSHMPEAAADEAAALQPTLLRQCQRLLENTYDKRTGVNLEDFVVGVDRYRKLAARVAGNEMAEYADAGRFFYYLSGGDLRMAIFYTDDLIHHLERYDPRRCLGDDNVLEFVIFLEELSHALHTSLTFQENRRRLMRPSFLAELEVQAKIDVFLLLVFFLQRLEGSERLAPSARRWIEASLFDRWSLAYSSPALARRYALAATLGRRAITYLDSLSSETRLEALRRLRTLSLYDKRRLLKAEG